ncbi:MAG: hypothetical protein JWM19_603, partial [Actinomycetia bacterium]|nr:hypothetical protein [Actinomycetes bacterium]
MSRLSRLSRAERAANALLAGIPDREPRVTMAAFDRAMMARTPEAENALFAIASVPYLDDEDDDDDGQPEHVLT